MILQLHWVCVACFDVQLSKTKDESALIVSGSNERPKKTNVKARVPSKHITRTNNASPQKHKFKTYNFF